ncbi:MAG: hypothetical protein ABIQ31_27135 [Ferruginibacter sp.]
MKRKKLYFPLLLATVLFISWKVLPSEWLAENHKIYTLYYQSADSENKKEYVQLVDNALQSVHFFFNDGFNNKFGVYFHPNRQSLDSQWQSDFNTPGLKSDCWMVASGTSKKLDVISPRNWDKESCEHNYADKIKVQELITHELFHVFHSQFITGSDFTKTDHIDWFVEGLATYASGQCDSLRLAEVRSLIANNQVPKSLYDFWKGKSRYGLSGSMVMFTDIKYGRKKLKMLLKFDKTADLLSSLNISEAALLDEWKKYFES